MRRASELHERRREVATRLLSTDKNDGNFVPKWRNVQTHTHTQFVDKSQRRVVSRYRVGLCEAFLRRFLSYIGRFLARWWMRGRRLRRQCNTGLGAKKDVNATCAVRKRIYVLRYCQKEDSSVIRTAGMKTVVNTRERKILLRNVLRFRLDCLLPQEPCVVCEREFIYSSRIYLFWNFYFILFFLNKMKIEPCRAIVRRDACGSEIKQQLRRFDLYRNYCKSE